MKKNWIEEFDAISRIIKINDPLGLIDGGAPDDEYEIEALEVFTKWKNNLLKTNNCFEEVMEVFLRMFGRDAAINEEGIKMISKAILNLH